MKNFALKVGKAALAATAVMLAGEHFGPKLPAALVIKGKDVRPYVVGTVAMLGLMYLPGKAAPVKATGAGA